MKRLLLWTAMLALIAVSASCGGDDPENEETSGNDVASFCELAAEASANAAVEMSPEEEREALEEFRDSAPDEVKEDVAVVVNGLLEALESGDETVLSSEEYQAAGARMSEWGEENCPQAEG